MSTASVGDSFLGALVLSARHHNVHLSVDQLEHEHSLRASEVGWSDIVRLAHASGLHASAARLSWREVSALGSATPAIVRLTSGHAMVLLRVEVVANLVTVVLQDPLAGENALLTLDETRFFDACTGDIILMRRHYPLDSDDQPFGIRAIAARMVQNRQIVRDIAISAVMLGLLSLSPILFWALMLDRVLYYKAYSTFAVLCMAMAIMVVFETCFGWLRRHLAQNLVKRIDMSLWNTVFAELLKLPVTFFERMQTGVITRDVFELFKIRAFITEQLFGQLLDIVVVLMLLPVMLLFSPLLTVLFLGICVLICLWVVVMLPALHRRTARVYAAEGRKGAFLVETLQGIRTVKSLALDASRRREWDRLVSDAAERRYAEASLANVVQTVILPFERLMTSGVVAVAVWLAMTTNDQVFVGSLVAFMMLTMRVAAPLINLSTMIQAYEEAKIGVEIVKKIVDQPKETGRSSNSIRPPLRGRVEFRDVRFTYAGALTPALDQISFVIPEGTVFGIMGRSGSGKTTVTRLLQRLHEDYLGSIRLDDHNLAQFHLDYLRSRIGVVLQDNFLFSGTVAETITATKPEATFEEIVRAARLAGAEEFIERLPQGYDTYIFEGSPNLSGGQRQRLAIARALINDPKLLILDEATSALDAESEAIVNANLMRIATGRTVIIISHRLSSLVVCDAIMVLERGKVLDIGRHDELLGRCDIYSSLWHQQNRHIEYTRQVSDDHEAA